MPLLKLETNPSTKKLSEGYDVDRRRWINPLPSNILQFLMPSGLYGVSPPDFNSLLEESSWTLDEAAFISAELDPNIPTLMTKHFTERELHEGGVRHLLEPPRGYLKVITRAVLIGDLKAKLDPREKIYFVRPRDFLVWAFDNEKFTVPDPLVSAAQHEKIRALVREGNVRLASKLLAEQGLSSSKIPNVIRRLETKYSLKSQRGRARQSKASQRANAFQREVSRLQKNEIKKGGVGAIRPLVKKMRNNKHPTTFKDMTKRIQYSFRSLCDMAKSADCRPKSNRMGRPRTKSPYSKRLD